MKSIILTITLFAGLCYVYSYATTYVWTTTHPDTMYGYEDNGREYVITTKVKPQGGNYIKLQDTSVSFETGQPHLLYSGWEDGEILSDDETARLDGVCKQSTFSSSGQNDSHVGVQRDDNNNWMYIHPDTTFDEVVVSGLDPEQ